MSAEEKRNIATKPQALDMEKWRAIVNGWEVSKESQKSYCKHLGININTFTYARGKLSGNKKSKTSFIPVVLKNEAQQGLQKTSMITIENKQGLKLHVPSTLSLDQLAKIFQLCGWHHA